MSNFKAGANLLTGFSKYTQGVIGREAGRFEADQYRAQAQRQRQAGDLRGALIRKKGAQAVGSAKVAMAAQGGTVNSPMLNEMKRDADLDALSAMWDARADALQSERAAASAEFEGQAAYRKGVIGVATHALKAGSTFKWGGRKVPPKKQMDYYKTARDQMQTGRYNGRGF